MIAVLRRLTRRLDRVVLVALPLLVLVVALVVDRPALGVYATGGVAGAAVMLQSLGIVLVFRSNRIINFAQVQMGSLAAAVFLGLVHRATLLHGLKQVCPACLPEPKTVGDVLSRAHNARGASGELLQRIDAIRAQVDAAGVSDIPLPQGTPKADLALLLAPRWLQDLSYVLSLALALALGTLLVWLVYVLIVRRFNQAPKLVLTVATIGAGTLMSQAAAYVLDHTFAPDKGAVVDTRLAAPLPWDVEVHVGTTVLGTADLALLMLAIASAVGIALWFRRSASGVALRGSSENAQRAETLGINVNAVTGRVWLLAGLLGGASAVLQSSKLGADAVTGSSQLVRALAAAVAGGLVSLPLTVAGAFVVGQCDQLVLWLTGSQEVVAGILLVFVTVVLLAQRVRSSRAEIEAAGSWEASREVRPIPSELSGLLVVRRTKQIGMALFSVVVLACPWVMSPGQVSLGIVTLLFGVVALSLLVLTGWAGQISLGQMGFAAIGAWVAAASGLPLLLGVLVAGVVGSLVAAAVAVPALRLRGLYLVIPTVAFAYAVSSLVISQRYLGSLLPDGLSRPVLLGIDLESNTAFYYFCLVVLVAATVAVAGMRRSRLARVLIAARDNEQAIQAFGVNLLRARLAVFAISGFLCAVAGALLAYAQHGVQQSTFAPEASVVLFLVVILGGLGSLTGPLLGALYLGLTSLIGNTSAGPLVDILLSPGLGVIVLLLVMPGGLGQGVFAVRDAWLRRIASRHRILVPSLMGDRAQDSQILLAPKLRPGGAPAFVPTRYRLEGQWMLPAHPVRQEASGRG